MLEPLSFMEIVSNYDLITWRWALLLFTIKLQVPYKSDDSVKKKCIDWKNLVSDLGHVFITEMKLIFLHRRLGLWMQCSNQDCRTDREPMTDHRTSTKEIKRNKNGLHGTRLRTCVPQAKLSSFENFTQLMVACI